MASSPDWQRLDLALVERGLAESRTRATRLIAAGSVRVDSRIVTKPGHRVDAETVLTVTALDRWVARSAAKLLAACERFDLDFTGRTVLDVGASTGGFTEVALFRGARHVIALDVGHGQLHPTLRTHSRVTVREGVNVRDLTGDDVSQWNEGHIDDVVADVSFISLTIVVPALVAALGTEFRYAFLIKPQFEVGKGNLVNGVVKDAAKRDASVLAVCEAITATGLPISGVMASPLEGEHGNKEAIVYGSRETALDTREWMAMARSVWGG